MDKERSEWIKKYRLDHGVSDQAARKAYLKHNQNTTETQPIVKSQVTCPTCKGSGRVPISSKPKERELTELPRLLPRRL
jgi:RecJ-like exonuclease